jgi:tRNA dimethylallyltransferase
MTTEAATVADVSPPEGEELLVVVGPTASGKTELAIRLAERFGGEIVSADSVQIVKHFDLGSGKPTNEERARAPHHLIDVADPLEPMDAALFARLADEAIAAIRARGHVPILAGGTYLWVKVLLQGLAEAAPRDDAVRQRHTRIAEEEGRAALHTRLAEIDPKSAARLAPNDLVRVSRALEVFELSGRPLSEWHASHAFATDRYRARLLTPARERSEIDARIEARARRWLEEGWLDEVQSLVERGYGEARAMGSVGYRQVRAFLGTAPEARPSHEALLQEIVRGTRVFVRRQRTWLRDLKIQHIHGSSAERDSG